MKAKTYYARILECKTEEEFNNELSKILEDMIQETDDLIRRRNCKSRDAIRSCVLEANQKYNAFVSLHNKNIDNDKIDHEKPWLFTKFDEKGFITSIVHIHPDYEKFFVKDREYKSIEDIKKQIQKPPLIPYHVTPIDEIKVEDCHRIFLECMMALSNYYEAFGSAIGFPAFKRMIMPLVLYSKCIEKWAKDNAIDYTCEEYIAYKNCISDNVKDLGFKKEEL